MASTTWGIAKLDYDISDGFCHTSHYTVNRVDGDYSASTYGSVTLTRPETLTSRTELSNADIIADVKQVLGAATVEAIENSLALKISEEKTPTQGSFTPTA